MTEVTGAWGPAPPGSEPASCGTRSRGAVLREAGDPCGPSDCPARPRGTFELQGPAGDVLSEKPGLCGQRSGSGHRFLCAFVPRVRGSFLGCSRRVPCG